MGLMYMHEHLIVHGDLKGVGNRFMIPATCDTIVPTGKHPNKPGWSCLSCRLCTLQGSRCRCRLRSLRPHALGWEPRGDNSFEMCSMAKPRTCGGFQTNQGVRCVRLGDGHLCRNRIEQVQKYRLFNHRFRDVMARAPLSLTVSIISFATI